MEHEKITGKRLKTHWTYNAWKYAAAVVLCVLGVDLLFTVTAYRPPEEKKIEIYLCNGYMDTVTLEEELVPKILERCPDQEEITVLGIDLTSGDVYTQMQFSTYMAAKQGDLCLLPYEQFTAMAGEEPEGVFVDLTEYIEAGVIAPGEMDVRRTSVVSDDGVRHIYGLPTDSLKGLKRYSGRTEGGVLCLTAFGGNDENAARALQLLMELTEEE